MNESDDFETGFTEFEEEVCVVWTNELKPSTNSIRFENEQSFIAF
jgi:hypothetical protein